MHVTGLQLIWFVLIGFLWAGYFFLEGFDFGIGMLLPFITNGDLERRGMLNAIGPIWDGNEVWLIVAGGATFAAFPLWYSTMFSAFYLALFVVLVMLIVRGMSFEFRGLRTSTRWRANWDRVNFLGSLIPSLIWGVAFADLLKGIPLNAQHQYTGTFLGLLQPYALLGGLTMVALFVLHGATFLSLKTTGELHDKATMAARRVAPAATVILLAFLAWTYFVARAHGNSGAVPGFIPVTAFLLVAAVSWLVREHLNGWAFVFTGVAILALTITIFMTLYPNVITSSTAFSDSLSIATAASQRYTLNIMTIVAVIFTPFVLLYQGWTYWIFRKRLTLPKTPSTVES
ncbi:MAG: cytochrome d ubiquinol oxidase subunit II [Ferrimicrobium sp.]|uniref:cytochrome d ubiquinol oxidase subunit II n=1 Tax=Ferrimicrobium sp. TaxID=2926050 RepID=UPI00260A1206|nr:cytochrome d ubiquinol oxidase subunit II [Ferrimicrobium sp.]